MSPELSVAFRRARSAAYAFPISMQDYIDVVFGFQDDLFGSNWRGWLENYKYAYGRYLPYIRQELGMELMAGARPDFSRLYERE